MKYDDNNQLVRIRYLIGLPPTPEEREGKFDMNLDTSRVKFFNEGAPIDKIINDSRYIIKFKGVWLRV